MKIQSDEDSSAFIDNKQDESIKESKKAEQPKISMKTPQFPYKKWQVYIIYSMYLMIFTYIVFIFQKYVITNYHEIRPYLVKSHLSEFIEQYFQRHAQSQIQNNQPLRPFQIFNEFKINIYRYSNDAQWQAYRNNLWLLILTALIWKFLTNLFYHFDRFIFGRQTHSYSEYKFSYINSYIFVFSLMVLLFSFRADLIFYLSIILFWWSYVQMLTWLKKQNKSKKMLRFFTLKQFNNLAIVSFWAIMLITLYLNEMTGHFRSLSTWFEKRIPQFLSPLKNSYRAIHCSQFLNMTFLRLLSYGIDRIHQGDSQWQEKQNKLKIKKLIPCEECSVQQERILYCYKSRDHIIKKHHSLKDYLNYTLFTPLLLTGPPISYNNFFSFQNLPSPNVRIYELFYHFLLILSFQLYQHVFPVVTLTSHMSLLQMEIFSLFHLVFIWYKFLIIWKTARIWAKLYGVHVIDNMSRCIYNNYGFQGFWRMWHRGFNHWLIRYLYVPLGGKNNIISILAVVSFVAFWHDHTINIIFWGLIIALFMVPQILIKRYFRNHQRHLYQKYWFKYVAGLFSSLYIHFLVICNCIGFGYGMGKMSIVFDKIISEYTTIVWSVTLVTFPTLCMFHKRNLENNSKNF